jgi:hypothetical protein
MQRLDAAFSMIGPAFGFSYAIWRDPFEDRVNMDWIKETARALAPAVTGHYLGEADLGRSERVRGCFSPDAWTRLAELQAKNDPSGILRSRQ